MPVRPHVAPGRYIVTTATGSRYDITVHQTPEGRYVGTLQRVPEHRPAAGGYTPAALRRDGEHIPIVKIVRLEVGQQGIFELDQVATVGTTSRFTSVVTGITPA